MTFKEFNKRVKEEFDLLGLNTFDFSLEGDLWRVRVTYPENKAYYAVFRLNDNFGFNEKGILKTLKDIQDFHKEYTKNDTV